METRIVNRLKLGFLESGWDISFSLFPCCSLFGWSLFGRRLVGGGAEDCCLDSEEMSTSRYIQADSRSLFEE